MGRAQQFPAGKAAHFRDLLGPHAIGVEQAAGRVGAAGREFPLAVTSPRRGVAKRARAGVAFNRDPVGIFANPPANTRSRSSPARVGSGLPVTRNIPCWVASRSMRRPSPVTLKCTCAAIPGNSGTCRKAFSIWP
jgi:hypothetical protein